MGRRPEVFVRPVSMAEGQKLQRISRTAKDPVKLRRAVVVLMSAQGQPVPDIAHLMQVGEDYVRDVIHTFNERGFDALDHDDGGDGPGGRSALEDRVAPPMVPLKSGLSFTVWFLPPWHVGSSGRGCSSPVGGNVVRVTVRVRPGRPG